jgi:cellulose synthase/poly-beta-1,6-N-acetylglucosamine synthase-like glycosyltransferase/peptidoglycan/xylan/chitin deacetylase (PgdA/CDA1 family)/spore germination protein YaaH
MTERKPIFYDEQRRRWRRTRRVLEISGGLFTLLIVVFLVNVIRNPNLPDLLRVEVRPGLHAIRSKLPRKPPVLRPGRRHKVAALGNVPQNYDPLRAAFYVPWDSTSFASLQAHYRDIDLLIPEALHAVSPDGRLDVEPDPKLSSWIKNSGIELPVMSLVNNYDGRNWRIPEMAQMLARPDSRQRLASALVNYALTQRQPGIVVDFEEVPDSSQANFRKFALELGAALHAAGLKMMIALPARDNVYDYHFFAQQADAVILMNYDQHWPASPPGPIVAQDWYLRNLQDALKLVPAEKLMMGVANYTYDWPVPKRRSPRQPPPTAQSFSFQEAIIHAVESEATVEFDSDSLNPHYSYEDENNVVHNVWLLDGVTAYNQLRAAERLGVRGTALWRLGTEDPSLWSIWDATHPNDSARAKLQDCPPGYDLILEGDGDIWRITATPQSGHRTFDFDASADTFTDETYQSYPLSWRIQQLGADPHKIAVTFDDGPDPEWTPKILDVLQEKHAPGTFFVTGVEADRSPGILRREYTAGDEIGNHTYTHPNFEQISRAQLQIELNLTQQLLESTLGVKTLLFRPPYGIDHQPEAASEVTELPIPQGMGYVIVGARVDPDDWGEPAGGPPAPAEVLVQRILDQVNGKVPGNKGNIILMHDGGGDRSHTVEALPVVIDKLRAEGYEFVTVSNLLGQTRAQMMPPLGPEERLFARADAFIFDLFHYFRLGIAIIFIAGIALVSGRTLIIGLLALAEKLRAAPADHPEYQPLVSVLIPAYNEEAVIVGTVESALASLYPKIEVIVVNDGSVDRTGELIRESFAGDSRVRLLEQSNRGKPFALNRAMGEARGEIAVTIDADTSVDPDAITKLVRHFANPRVAAVAGNVKVGNRNRWLTRWQALEYITSQNLEKRAFDLLNCIPVVPGAVGAWRVDAVRGCGSFSSDTVAEDTDLTLTLRRQGWKILYDEDAIGHTEAPDSVEALIRQRFRWTFGTLQAVWKHRTAVGRPRYGTLGWIAVPNIFLFQILLPLVSPVIDLMFLASIFFWGLAQFRFTNMPQVWTKEDVERSLVFFAVFMFIDVLTCVIAFALEKHEDWSLLAPLLIQRFYYRQMMYVVLFRALMGAVQGRAIGWRGVEPEISAPVAPA